VGRVTVNLLEQTVVSFDVWTSRLEVLFSKAFKLGICVQLSQALRVAFACVGQALLLRNEVRLSFGHVILAPYHISERTGAIALVIAFKLLAPVLRQVLKFVFKAAPIWTVNALMELHLAFLFTRLLFPNGHIRVQLVQVSFQRCTLSLVLFVIGTLVIKHLQGRLKLSVQLQ